MSHFTLSLVEIQSRQAHTLALLYFYLAYFICSQVIRLFLIVDQLSNFMLIGCITNFVHRFVPCLVITALNLSFGVVLIHRIYASSVNITELFLLKLRV